MSQNFEGELKMATTPAAAAPAADAHATDHGHGKEPWYKNGYTKAGIIFCMIIAVGFGLGSIAPEVNNFIVYVLGAFIGVIASALGVVTNFKTAIFTGLAAIAFAVWLFS